MNTFWLSMHVSYACRHTGVCCSSRWPIPIELDRAAAVRQAVRAGNVADAAGGWLEPRPGMPADMAGVLALQASGACIFHRAGASADDRDPSGRCGIHAMRPVSCEHFPFVCVVDPRGVHVTLSHYCPTAADLLFLQDGALEIVEGPPVLEDGREPEGLDARESLPPVSAHDGRASSPPRLMDWAEVTAWERAFVASLASDVRIPEAPDLALVDRAISCVAPGLDWPHPMEDAGRLWHEHVGPQWGPWARVVGRYLASRAHASWAMCLGRGPGDVEQAVAVARAVLQVEAIRACASSDLALDRRCLTLAIRRTDLLLLHYADAARWWRPPRHPSAASGVAV
jgi:Fe-S-cluster containining protein